MAGEGRPLTKMEAIRDLVNGNRLDLNGLNTSNKASIVEAVNEIVSGIGAVISDSITSTWTTWSSSKIFTELGKKASSVNPTFTGTIGIPDASLSLAKTSGLSSALNSKVSTLNPTFTGTVTVPDASFTIAKVKDLQKTIDTPFNPYGGKYAADPPTAYPAGYSVGMVRVTGNSDGDWPADGAMNFRTVVTFKVSGYTSATVQYAYPYLSDTATILRRIAMSSTSWGTWKEA